MTKNYPLKKERDDCFFNKIKPESAFIFRTLPGSTQKRKTVCLQQDFLILFVVCSLVIPVVYLPVNTKANQPLEKIGTALNSIIPSSDQVQNQADSGLNISVIETFTPGINLQTILYIIYFLGVSLFIVRFFLNISAIYGYMRTSEKTTYKGCKLFLCYNQFNPFCFFNSIFVSRQDYLDKTIDKDLLDHEAGHIKQSHFIDILFIELIRIFYWFNPIIILYNRAIRVNHEFLADDYVIRNSDNIKSYSDILLNFIDYKSKIALTSGLYNSQTKKLLIMMII